MGWELPRTFLGLDEEASAWSTARAVLLPVPYESTTSYGGGARSGPGAILEASRYVELWDQELGRDPSAVGIHTLPALELTRQGPAEAAAELEEAYAAVAEAAGDRFLVMLGGEHSVSAPAIRAQAKRTRGRLSVLQLDAHADLRPAYEGTPHSHASAMARVLDVADVVGVGIRGISRQEVEAAAESERITLIYGEEVAAGDGWMDRALDALGDPVYLTFDVDYFDPAVMPSTGTPEPGGGEWYPTLRFLRRVFRERTVVACDVVELAPTPGLHAPDFLAAKLVYKLIAYRFEAEA
ncbi:MAG: agmatinase [Gemmatimonadetes bacterium]|nr:agmatinase [Gemmatimonadota bacterium]NIR78392.1 agmatinase [Gemmatimonadota bacterium]NIT86996.1 agmatinase [Gemmatimonadota bacterium]NIU30840.1 agmatinase [Gemmatimonadota bacterium]NIU35612.1 agmatinase [Gemmatimonadota bacterium]